MPPLLSRISGAVALAALIWCLGATAVAGWEDHLARSGRRGAIERAVRLAPGDARNYGALASLGGTDRSRNLELAVRASPYNSQAWIALGLDAEMLGDEARAERCLLQAARVDKTYAPRWSLANFYFRRNSPERFLPWLREAARMSYGDPRPLAALAWNLAGDSPETLAALSDRLPVLESYVSLLLDNDRLGPAETAAGKLLEAAGKNAAGAVLVYSDRFLDAGRPEAALRLWNRLALERFIPGQPLDPDRGPHLTNGNFDSEPLSRGFDWRPQAVAGVEMVRQPSGAACGSRSREGSRNPACSCSNESRWLLAGPGGWRSSTAARGWPGRRACAGAPSGRSGRRPRARPGERRTSSSRPRPAAPSCPWRWPTSARPERCERRVPSGCAGSGSRRRGPSWKARRGGRGSGRRTGWCPLAPP